MKIVMVMVSSIDGKITKGDDPHIYSWTSAEDAEYFFSLIRESKLIMMGSGTYDVVQTKIKPKPGTLRIILTRNPEKYASDLVFDQLEFSNESPKQLVKCLEQRGFTDLLLVGGSVTNALFLKEKLVDELWLTIEPKLFGVGKHIVDNQPLNINLALLSTEKLNEKGTLLLKYTLEYTK